MSFPKYSSYKDSGVEWLGQVPEHWASIRYKNVFNEKGFVTASSLPPGSISYGRVVFKDDDFLHEPTKASYQEVLSGEFLINPINLNYDLKSLRTALSAIDTCVSPAYIVLSSKVAADKNYLKHQLHVFDLFHMKTLGAGVRQTITFGDIGGCVTFLPPLTEQISIAAFLDRETGKIDALVAEQRRLMELLKEKRQAVISHAVTRGLNPVAPLKPSGIEWLGDVPEHWEVIALKRIADVQTGVAKGKDNSSRTTITVPYLRVANVQDGYLDLETVATIEIPAEDLDRYSLKCGDVLMNEGGDYDKLGRGCVWDGQIDPCITQNHVFAVRPRLVASAWLNAITSSDFAQFYFMGRSKQSTNLASISSTNLMELPVILPPEEEQREILSFIADQTSRFDTLTAEAQRAIDLLQERRTALISAAVTGQIDVRPSSAASLTLLKPFASGFARQLLAAEVLHHCHQHPTTGRVKLQKLIHLCEHVAELEEVGAHYARRAAGPYDNKMMYGIAKGLSVQKWFSEVRDGQRTFYRPLEKAGEHQKYLAHWESKLPQIHRVLQLLGKAETQQCEIVSTLYAAWNDLLIEGKSPSDKEIIFEASDAVRWHESKTKIPAGKWPVALQWMREKALIPKGFGNHTKAAVSDVAVTHQGKSRRSNPKKRA